MALDLTTNVSSNVEIISDYSGYNLTDPVRMVLVGREMYVIENSKAKSVFEGTACLSIHFY